MKQINEAVVCIVGLGFIGLSLALKFDEYGFKTYGFDIKKNRINELKKYHDSNNQFVKEKIKRSRIVFSNNPDVIKKSNFIIVAVQTPITKSKLPNLQHIKKASRIIGRHIKKGSTVVFESTIYPGTTENICKPILEVESNLFCGEDFYLGYCPERINIGDNVHGIDNTVKVISGINKKSLDKIATIYEKVFGKIFKVKNIVTAEASKLVENIQRDINIAFMNELTVLFNKMNINIYDVLKACSTKWNFSNYTSGIVGGYCIPNNPYYLIHLGKKFGCNLTIISNARKINKDLYKTISDNIIKYLNCKENNPKNSSVLIAGLTYKENVNIYSLETMELARELKKRGLIVFGIDPFLGRKIIENVFDIGYVSNIKDRTFNCIIFLISHDKFKNINLKLIRNRPIIIDIKGLFDPEKTKKMGFEYHNI